MRILVRMPNWIGDAVMETPALNNLVAHHPDARFVLVGSPLVAEMLRPDPRFHAVLADTSKQCRSRLLGIAHLGRQLRAGYGPFDLAWSFVNSLSSRLLCAASRARRRVARRHGWHDVMLTDAIGLRGSPHEARAANQIVNTFLGTDYPTGPTALYVEKPERFPRPTAGINPGAAYGESKRWLADRFAETARALAADHDIVLFGGPRDRQVVARIEAQLKDQGVGNVRNAVGCTMAQLLSLTAGLRLFVTNDTGPMHIAGALAIPTVAVFGSTDPARTSPWDHPHVKIVCHALPCAPCKERICPLKHHDCMRQIEAAEVIRAARTLAAQTAPAHSA